MAGTSDHHALLLATNSYAKLTDLVALHSDIAALEQVLTDPDQGGYLVRTLRDPTLSAALRQIEGFCQDRVPRDTTMIYISGHGQLDGEGRLVFPLTDSDPSSLHATSLSASWLSERLTDCRSRNLLLIVDTCFSGAVASSLSAAPSRISAWDHFGSNPGFVALTSANNRQEAFQRSAEAKGPRLSIFTHHLVQGLVTGDADRNGDGYVSVGELYSYLVDAIQMDEPQQIPSRAGYQEGDFAVMRSRARLSMPSRQQAEVLVSGHEALRQTYLRWVQAQTRHLDLSIIEKDFAQNAVDVRSVYSPLSTTTRLILDIAQNELRSWRAENSGTETSDISSAVPRTYRDKLEPMIDRIRSIIRIQAYRGNGFTDGDYPYNFSTADAVALWERLVLTGAPGSGKTTLARHVAVSLAESALSGESTVGEDMQYWALPVLTPVFIRLHDLVSRNFPPVDKPISLDDFIQYLKGHLNRAGLSASSLYEYILEDFSEGRVFLILDGLDEVPEAHSQGRRAQIISLVELISVAYPKTRILVTSRPHAYAGDWVLPGFVHEELAPLSVDQAEQIALNIFNLAYSEPKSAQGHAFDFVSALARVREELQTDPSLWSSPLLLSLMCALWLRRSNDLSEGSLPRTRGGLYREAVDLLIERWTAKHRREEESLTDILHVSPSALRNALERLALICHGRLSDEVATPWFSYGDLLDSVLAVDSTARVNTFELAEFLSRRSGIILELAPNRLAFAHFSFQEHLAACWLTRPELFPDGIKELMLSNPQRWRDVADLVAAECEFCGRLGDLAMLVRILLAAKPGAPPEDPAWTCVLVASILFWRYLYSSASAADVTLVDQLRGSIMDTLNAGALAPGDRALVGAFLSELGDRRAGVGLNAEGIPDIDWSETISISDASGTPGGVSSFQVSNYTVTNLQFLAFLTAEDGYSNKRWWTEQGLDWCSRFREPPDISETGWALNCPYVEVSWFEAGAFTRWLGSALGTDIRLPTSAEWQAAAGGPDMLEYPYGDQFKEGANNTRLAGIGRTCAVGIFPEGRSAYGPFDLGGNVFEWTSTPWPEPDGVSPGLAESSYIVCGASYDSSDRACMRSAHCFPRRPASRVPQRGFRIARSV
jgi:formylglycine-generating enzyme required for sulfatase activity